MVLNSIYNLWGIFQDESQLHVEDHLCLQAYKIGNYLYIKTDFFPFHWKKQNIVIRSL